MKNVILLFILFCLFFSCKSNNEINLKIQEAEELIRAEQPDSAFALLESITNPEVLSDKVFAHFCMVSAGLSEQLGEDMPFVPQMERANDYYEKHGSPEDKMNSLLYLGMAYEGETDYEWAMKSYLSAVELAKKAKNYRLVGKLYNKMAKLHDFDDNYEEAKQCHLLSGEYYLKGKDSINYIYSIRDIGRIYMLKEDYDAALRCHQDAYRLALPLNDSLLLSSLTNRLGNNYEKMGNYALAEKFLFQSIAYDEAGSAPTYLTLADLYLYQKKYDKTREYIEKAILSKTAKRPLTSCILYQSYMLEKELGNYSLALDYYECFNHFADSIIEVQSQIDLRKVEKRYKHAEILNRNAVLELRHSRILGVSILLGVLILISVYVYIKKLDREKDELKKKQEDIAKSLQEKEFEVQGLSGKIKGIRKGILENTGTYKKIMQNACSIEEAKKNPLTNEDWLSLYGSLKITYPFFMEGLEKQFPGLTEEERHFCCLLKLGLDNQQLAIFLNIQSTSVDRRRYRIRKKGKLENTQTTLEELIAAL